MKTRFFVLIVFLTAVSFSAFAADEKFDKNDFASVRKYAEQGSPEAQYYLGQYYARANNMAEAVQWYRKAAEQDDLDAQYMLGLCYERGEGVPKDAKKAVQWYRKAADRGIIEAQICLGRCYETGWGVEKNIPEAVTLYRQAADRKNPEAQYRLGFCYENYSEIRSYDKAAIWYRRAAERGYAMAQYRIALFYESGNESISREHMLEMKAIRDKYDPYGGRAIGSREMLDIDEAEYGGEMLYINKSKKHPMWAMEYCRDEGLRKYWDEWSYPYHKEGDGPLYRGNPATDYNHNMDQFAVEMVRRWYDYWRERPGTGTRVSSGGVKIVFSDTNTHHRGESNYRTSGVVDAMRIPKDAFFAHQVMWSGWVEPEEAKTYIVGHWNFPASAVKPVFVVSTGDEVELFLNGRSLGKGRQSYRYLFTFDDVPFEPGTLEAVASDGSRYKLETVDEPYQLKLTAIKNPEGTKADGADMVLFQVEVMDKEGRRCPIDDRMIHFDLWGEGKWIGGIGTRDNRTMQRLDENRPAGLLDAAATKNISDNYVGSYNLPVECGVNRVLVRTTPNAGEIHLSAYAEGVKPAYIEVKSEEVRSEKFMPQLTLKSHLDRGETPLTPSYTDQAQSIGIISAKAGYDSDYAVNSFDDNELSEWKNDGHLSTAWITYRLEKKSIVDDICLKLTGWRVRSYPLEVYAGKTLIWSGETERSLGYIHLKPTKRVKTDEITIRLKGAGKDKDAFGGIVEVAQPAAGELDLFKAKNGGDTNSELRIVEIELSTGIIAE